MSNVNFNRLLFYMFMEQNAEKTFDDFITLEGSDENYKGIKLKDLTLDDSEFGSLPNSVRLLYKKYLFLCDYDFVDNMFHGLYLENSFNILDHISFEDKI